MNRYRSIIGLLVASSASMLATRHSTSTSVSVYVKFQGRTKFACVNTNLNCESTGSSLCVVYIPDLLSETRAYASGCSISLRSRHMSNTYDPVLYIVDAAPL